METLEKQFPPHDFALLAIVLILPAIGAFVNGVFGKRLGKPAVRLMALSALGGSFLASVATFLTVLRLKVEEGQGPNASKLMWTAWTWLVLPTRGGKSIDVTFSVDTMTATMMLVVTGVGFLIHLYSSEYMIKDDGYHRFFAYLNLFCFSMLVLIMGDSLPVLFVGWEGVGLCSYLLIGFWFEEEKNASAGKKAFITNRIGDFGLLIAMAMLLYYTGALDWAGIKIGAHGLSAPVKVWPIGNLPGVHDIPIATGAIPTIDDLHRARADVDHQFPWLANSSLSGVIYWLLSDHYTSAATLVGLALFLGCAGKSAQIPLYVWLPDAMAGPTPVSALIHAATMVTAGVYLVARMSFVFVLSPAVMATVAVIGALTALLAASIGLFQKDLKKVLAYSTVSQLGYMFIGVGTGAFVAGFFHVFTHAFFKACLFLGAGSVIHAMHARIHDTDASQDMTNMGGLRKYMPHTHWTFLASCFSIAGAPFLAGFWSKDEILWKAYSSEIAAPPNAVQMHMWLWPTWLGPAIYWAGILGATMTAFYMFRAYFMTFWGEFRGWKIKPGWKDKHGGHHHDHHHEDPKKRVGPVPHESPPAMTIPLIILGTMAIVAGFFGAEALHIAPLTHRLEAGFEGISQVVHRPGVGEGQVWVMMVPGVLAFVVGSGAAYMVYAQGGGRAERNFQASFPRLYGLIYDKWRIDELYDATVIGMVDALADIFVMADQWFVDGILAKLSALIVSSVGSLLRLFQTGRVQVYAASMAVGVLGVGWFMTTPHAAYSIDQANLSTTGEVLVKPAPGLGYQYKWSGDGVKQNDFGSLSDYSFVVEPGKTRKVTLAVKNAFGRESDETITISRPVPKPGEGAPMFFPQQHAAAPDQAPGENGSKDNGSKDKGIIKVEGSQIGDLVKGGGQ